MEDNKQNQELPFINEKIKEKPRDRRHLLLQILWVMVCAVIFGFISCLTFVMVKPRLEERIKTAGDTPITIPKDQAPETNSNQGEVSQGANAASDEKGTQQPEEPVKKPIVVEEKLEPDSYQSLMNKMYAVGRKANRAVVTVTAVTSDFDELFQEPYEQANQAAGVIFENNGTRLLILTETKNLVNTAEISVTFINDDVVSAKMEQYDGNTGLAIISVRLDIISESTMKSIDEIKLGNSLSVSQGNVVLAIGSPQGSIYSILMGTITASNVKRMTWDSTYSFFSTDILSGINGSGVLINLEGEVIGLLLEDYRGVEELNTISAISISELKDKELIQNLSNGKNIPYMGLMLETLDYEIAEKEKIPEGVFVRDIRDESPAMKSGLQKGDVIVELAGEKIMTVDQYTNQLFSLQQGQEVIVKYFRQHGEEYIERQCTVEVDILR